MPPCPPSLEQTTAEQEGWRQEVRVRMAVKVPFKETLRVAQVLLCHLGR